MQNNFDSGKAIWGERGLNEVDICDVYETLKRARRSGSVLTVLRVPQR